MLLDNERLKSLNEKEVLEFFMKYFLRYYKNLSKKQVFSLPDPDHADLPRSAKTIMKTMEAWCNKSRGKRNMKGLIMYGYSLDEHLDFLNFSSETFQKHSVNSQHVFIVFNPAKKLILIIRKTEDEYLKDEMKLYTLDMIKSLLLYNDVLNKSRVTVINLLVTNKEQDDYPWRCLACNLHVVSIESLNSPKAFHKWCNDKEKLFHVDRAPKDVKEDYSFYFSAKVLGFLASYQFKRTQHYNGKLP